MRFYLLLLTTLCTARISVLAAEPDSASLGLLTKTIKAKYAPDRRTALFDVRLRSVKPLVVWVESTSSEAIRDFKSSLLRQEPEAQVLEQLLPDNNLKGHTRGIANLSVCNNRFEPDHAAEMATQILLGTPVEILKKEQGYFLVRTPDRYLSWTDDAGVVSMDTSAFNSWQSSDKIIVTSGFAQGWQKPSKHSLPVSDLVAGNILRLLGKKRGYYHVAYPDGRQAYVKLKDAHNYISWLAAPAPGATQLLNTAKNMMGVPYLWGGTSVKGVDCSGFTKTAFFLNGIIIARDASQQALYGNPVDIFVNDTVSIAKCLQNLLPGDLLFFAAGKNKVKEPRITHTAIYLGDGQFIQSAGMVRISSLVEGRADFDAYQTSHLVNARRVLTAIGREGITPVNAHPFYTVKQ